MKEVCSVLGALFAGCKDGEPADPPHVTAGTATPPVSVCNEADDPGAGLPPGVRIMHTHGEFA